MASAKCNTAAARARAAVMPSIPKFDCRFPTVGHLSTSIRSLVPAKYELSAALTVGRGNISVNGPTPQRIRYSPSIVGKVNL